MRGSRAKKLRAIAKIVNEKAGHTDLVYTNIDRGYKTITKHTKVPVVEDPEDTRTALQKLFSPGMPSTKFDREQIKLRQRVLGECERYQYLHFKRAWKEILREGLNTSQQFSQGIDSLIADGGSSISF